MTPSETVTSRWPYAVSGLLAAAVGMAVGHVVAALMEPAASPVLAVGSAVIDATPPAVKDWAVATLGTADKPVLVGAVSLVTLAVAAGIGLLARQRLTLALLGIVGLAAVAGLAAVRAVGSGVGAVAPAVLCGIAGVATLSALVHLSPRNTQGSEGVSSACSADSSGTGRIPLPSEPGRRQFLFSAGALGVGALAVAGFGEWLARPVAAARALVIPPVPAPLPALPEDLAGTVPGVSPLRTPTADFYRIDTALSIPRVDVDDWSLTVDGMVDREVTVTFDELVALGLVERDITLNCVSNEVGGPYIGSTRWTGVPVRLLLERAGVQASADQVLSTSVDGMTISTPVEALLATGDLEALVAVAMDGEPLPPRHGFPVRLITPGLYGYVGATKWVSRLTLTTFAAQQAYWSTRGWAEQAPVQVQARIDTPGRGASTGEGRVAIAGVAWAQATQGITAVEVQVDDGPWQSATLGSEVGPVYWRQWWLPWDAKAGRHRITVRAIDGTGTVQTITKAPVAPSGATGYHSIDVVVS